MRTHYCDYACTLVFGIYALLEGFEQVSTLVPRSVPLCSARDTVKMLSFHYESVAHRLRQ